MEKEQSKSSMTILVAVHEEWRSVICQFLESSGFVVLYASTQEEAFSIVNKKNLDGIVIISDWAATIDSKNGLMEMIKGKIPSVNLITTDTSQQIGYRWFDELYHPPLHEYCTVPVDKEELMHRLNSILQAQESN